MLALFGLSAIIKGARVSASTPNLLAGVHRFAQVFEGVPILSAYEFGPAGTRLLHDQLRSTKITDSNGKDVRSQHSAKFMDSIASVASLVAATVAACLVPVISVCFAS